MVGWGRFVFRLARGADPIYVAVHRPGLIQFFECGRVTAPDFTSGILVIKVPEPASLNILFDPGTKMAGDLPFDGVGLEVLGKDALRTSYSRVVWRNGAAVRQQLQVADLAPGTYRAEVLPRTKRGGLEPPPSTPHPGFYRDSREVVLSAGETRGSSSGSAA